MLPSRKKATTDYFFPHVFCGFRKSLPTSSFLWVSYFLDRKGRFELSTREMIQ